MIDLLDKVLNNIEDDDEDEDDKGYIFISADYQLAQNAKLDVLKWLETKGLFDEYECLEAAAEKGHIQILQWQ